MKKQILFLTLSTVLTFGLTNAEVGSIGLTKALQNSNENSAVACVMFAKSLKYGDGQKNNRHSEVRELQDKLFEKGYLKVSSTGYFGPATREAVKKYQKDNNIPTTGNVYNMTLGQLKKHFCEKKDDGNKNRPVTTDCKVWNDGCNTCSKASATDTNSMCTMMACPAGNLNKPYCKEYFPNTTQALLKACPTEKILDRMPIVCVKAPCEAGDRSYYIYNGVRKEISEFDKDYVKNNCTVKETVVY